MAKTAARRGVAAKSKASAKPTAKVRSKTAAKPRAAKPRAARARPKATGTNGKTSRSPAGRPRATRAARPAKPAPKRKARRVHFDAKTLRLIRGHLLEQREQLVEQLRDIEEAAFNAPQSEISGEVGYDEDYADSGSATFEREKDLSIANNVQDLLDKIEKALEKIDEGTYGICESCGEPIDAARLRALPNALLCIRCKKAEERR